VENPPLPKHTPAPHQPLHAGYVSPHGSVVVVVELVVVVVVVVVVVLVDVVVVVDPVVGHTTGAVASFAL